MEQETFPFFRGAFCPAEGPAQPPHRVFLITGWERFATHSPPLDYPHTLSLLFAVTNAEFSRPTQSHRPAPQPPSAALLPTMPSGLCEVWVPVSGPSDRESSPLTPAPGSTLRLPCDQRGTLNHPGLAPGSASQKSRSEVIRLVKYLPPDSPETRGAPARRRGPRWRWPGRNAGPAAGRQREPRGPGQAPTPACLRALRLRPRVSEKPGREGGQYGERKSRRVRAPGGSLAPPADKALRETGAQGTDAVGSGEPRRTPGTGAEGRAFVGKATWESAAGPWAAAGRPTGRGTARRGRSAHRAASSWNGRVGVGVSGTEN